MKRFSDLDVQQRTLLTENSIRERRTMLERWSAFEHFDETSWDSRSKAAADIITEDSVADFGCGSMSLERHLRPGTKYIPVDVVRRDDRTVVVDLNREPLPQLDASVAVGLGLIAYIHDVHNLMVTMSRYYKVSIISYSTTDHQYAVRDRLSCGWVNGYSRAELEAIFHAADYRVEMTRAIEGLPSVNIWRLVR